MPGSSGSRQRARPERTPSPSIVADRLSLFEFSVACEIFSVDRSSPGRSWYRFLVCAASPSPLSTSVPGVTINVPLGLGALDEAHTIVVPACELAASPPPALLSALRAAHDRGARIASLCTGAFILAAAGLLDGRRATTHWRQADELARRYPLVKVDPRVLYVDEGDVLTSAGSAASIDLCLHLVRQDFGAEVANEVAHANVVPPHREGGQAQYVSQPVLTGGAESLADTLEWAQGRLHESLPVRVLARRSAMSTRTFARRFRAVTGTTPHRWMLAQRVVLAQRLLETSNLSIDKVAARCGLGSAANLRQQFQRAVGTSPSAYRRTFRTAG